MRLAVFVTSHGFGHAGRASAVVDALHQRRPDLFADVFTEVPSAFLASSLRAPHRRIVCATDVGMVQRGPFDADLDATAEVMTRFLDQLDRAAEAAAAVLVEAGCRAALCDISPLGIVAAARAGIPSVLIENFRWDWIYAELEGAPAELREGGQRLGEIFAMADLHVQVAPVCDRVQRGLQVELPVARAARADRAATRPALGLGPADRIVLVTTGGVPGEPPFLDALHARSDVAFLVTGSDRSGRDRNVARIGADSPFYLPDLIRASDAVVAKLGYSTLAETWREGRPMLRIPRAKWPEGEVLSSWAAAHVPGLQLDEPSFRSGAWMERLDDLLAIPSHPVRTEAGQDRVADLILSSLASI